MFGLFWVDAYIYRCVLSNAKIELMCDLPYTKYHKKSKDGKKKYDKKELEEVMELNRQLARKWKAKAGTLNEEENG